MHFLEVPNEMKEKAHIPQCPSQPRLQTLYDSPMTSFLEFDPGPEN